MYTSLLVIAIILNCLVNAENKSKFEDSVTNIVNHGLTTSITKNNVASHHNITYIEKSENLLRTPNINKYYEEHKKKKKPKKTPKRTIQKIIKKNRAKLRKIYFTKKIKMTTVSPKTDYDRLYGQEYTKQRREERTTTQANQKKKVKRKYSPKFSGYHMPFQKLQKMDKRHKRGLSRELYILKDLDEIEFLSNDGADKDVVKAHVKNFW